METENANLQQMVTLLQQQNAELLARYEETLHRIASLERQLTDAKDPDELVCTPATISSTISVKQELKELQEKSDSHKEMHKLIETKYTKRDDPATIKDAANALVKLKAEGNEDFYNRFLDYLHTMGLRDAVLHLRTPTLDLTASSKKELNYQKLTEMLLAGSRRDDWHKANVKLKAQLDEQMYREFVAHIPTEDDNFFVLWDKVIHHLGKTESVVSQRVLMKKWSKLVMPADGNLTTFLGQISAISERVNTLAGHTVYGDELKIHQLADGVEVHNGTRFKQAIDKIRTSTKKKTWEQVKALFKATDSKRYSECIYLEDKDKGQAISSNTETKQMGTHCRY